MSTTAERSAVGAELALEMYRRMTLIRLFEEQANELYRTAKMPGLTHLYIGEEAVAVGVCSGAALGVLLAWFRRERSA